MPRERVTSRNARSDIVDIVTAALAFGCVLGNSKWNPDADLNIDGLIDIIDLVTIGVNFGRTA